MINLFFYIYNVCDNIATNPSHATWWFYFFINIQDLSISNSFLLRQEQARLIFTQRKSPCQHRTVSCCYLRNSHRAYKYTLVCIKSLSQSFSSILTAISGWKYEPIWKVLWWENIFLFYEIDVGSLFCNLKKISSLCRGH